MLRVKHAPSEPLDVSDLPENVLCEVMVAGGECKVGDVVILTDYQDDDEDNLLVIVGKQTSWPQFSKGAKARILAAGSSLEIVSE